MISEREAILHGHLTVAEHDRDRYRKAIEETRDQIQVMHSVAFERNLPDYIVADLSRLKHELSVALRERQNDAAPD